jgi:hypothetical protein
MVEDFDDFCSLLLAGKRSSAGVNMVALKQIETN